MDQHLFARGRGVLLTVIITAVACLISLGSCLEQRLVPLNDACTCTGDQLRLTCTVISMGSGVTVWRVEDCDDIFLLNSGFSEGITRERTCMGPVQNTVVGRSVSVNGDCYTSELSLTAISQLDGTVVRCLQDNGTVTLVGNYSIALVTDPHPAPSDVSLTDISSQGLTFSWTTAAPNCSSVSYNVNASGCGNCPVSTNSTSVVCSDVRLSGENRSCDFQVQTVTCGNLVSGYSNTVTTVLQAPDQPMATIVPRYQQDSTYLTSFSVAISQMDPVTISGYNITTQSYVLSYRTNNVMCDSRTIESTACTEDICQTEFALSRSSCSPSPPNGDFTLSVSATSVLGTGPPSTMTIARSSADFVRVNISDSSISCSFTNTQDTTTKTCNVSYGQCGGELGQTAQANSSSEGVNLVTVQLDIGDSTSFCYVVTASNDTYSVQVEGSVGMATTASTATTEPGGGTAASGGLQGGAIAAIIIVFILLAAGIAVVVTVVIVMFVFKRRRTDSQKVISSSTDHPDEEKELDVINSSHVSERPFVGGEKESPPPAENGDGNVKEEPATAKETVDKPTDSTTSTSIPLTVDNIVHKLSDYSSKWDVMGETLSLSEDQIDEIRTSGETDEACLRAMVERYLQLTSVNHSWEEVNAALERAKEAQNQEIEKRLKKHPDQVPVIIERHRGEEVLEEKAKTLWIPKKLTIAQLGAAIRKPSYLDLRQEQSLYLNIGGKTVLTGKLEDLYTTHKHVDGYLHITYSSQEKYV